MEGRRGVREASREPGLGGRRGLKPRERPEPQARTLCVACQEDHTGSRVTTGVKSPQPSGPSVLSTLEPPHCP